MRSARQSVGIQKRRRVIPRGDVHLPYVIGLVALERCLLVAENWESGFRIIFYTSIILDFEQNL